jgi:nucleoid-associated protein
MEISNAVVHRLQKQRNAKGATVHAADAEIIKNAALSELLQHVLESYNSRCSRHAGSFEEDVENYRFSVGVESFLQAKTDFLSFSTLAMERLRFIINDIIFAAGGYVLFVRYAHNGREMLLVAQLNQETGAIFSSDLHEVVQSKYLNLDRLKVAARVDLDAWADGEERYLTFVLRKDEGHPSDYFREFIGCRIEQDSKVESNKVIKVVKDFATKLLDDKFITADLVPDVQRRAYDYAEDLRKLPEPGALEFDALANAVWPDRPEMFLSFLNNHPEQPSSGFIPDRTTFRKLSNISFKSRDLSLKMTYEFKQQHVTTEGNKVVIHEAPPKLIQELTEGR